MGVVFAKTPKGQAEIATKAGGLTPRQRRVLIMVDGKRTVAELREMLLADDLQHTLGLLEESGHIEMSAVRDPVGVDHPPPKEGLPSITAFRPLPEKSSTPELEMARNFIMNSLRTFCGPYGHLDIVEAAFAAHNHETLRTQFAPWFHAIVATSSGRRRAEELRSQLLKVI